MKRDFLKGLGLEDEVIDKIVAENGKDITALKVEISNLKDEIATKEGVIQTKNSKIKELEEIDVDSIKQQEYDRGKAEGTAEIEKFKFDTALKEALTATKAKDVKSLIGFLDKSSIKYEDGKISGLDEQITPLKESHGFLFEDDSPKPKFADKTDGTDATKTDENSLRKAMGLPIKED